MGYVNIQKVIANVWDTDVILEVGILSMLREKERERERHDIENSNTQEPLSPVK